MLEDDSYLKWPDQPMIRALFGGYLEHKVNPSEDWKVLDVGCGCGNNLVPFMNIGCDCYGVEPEAETIEFGEQVLNKRGYSATLEQGENRDLPFPDDKFDLLLSINVLHYETNEEDYRQGLREYARVLKDDGVLFLETLGSETEAYQEAEIVGPHQFRRQNVDFRDDWEMFYVSNEKYLKNFMSDYFGAVETGRSTSDLMTKTRDYLLAAAFNPFYKN
jgi:ubiquinone/menaquinone biosynthesis C-methylase UbiE